MKTYIRSTSFTGDSLKFQEVTSDASEEKRANFYFQEEASFTTEPQLQNLTVSPDTDEDLSQEMSDAYYKATLKPIV